MRTSDDDLQDLARRSARIRRRVRAAEPKRAADVMAAVLQRRGYGRMIENEQLAETWAAAVDPRLRPLTRAVRVYRRRLEVVVASSAVLQELTFAKRTLVERFNAAFGGQTVTDIRLRIGEVRIDK